MMTDFRAGDKVWIKGEIVTDSSAPTALVDVQSSGEFSIRTKDLILVQRTNFKIGDIVGPPHSNPGEIVFIHGEEVVIRNSHGNLMVQHRDFIRPTGFEEIE